MELHTFLWKVQKLMAHLILSYSENFKDLSNYLHFIYLKSIFSCEHLQQKLIVFFLIKEHLNSFYLNLKYMNPSVNLIFLLSHHQTFPHQYQSHCLHHHYNLIYFYHESQLSIFIIYSMLTMINSYFQEKNQKY